MKMSIGKIIITWSVSCILSIAFVAVTTAASDITETTLPGQLVSGDGSVVAGTWFWLDDDTPEEPSDSPFRWNKADGITVLFGLAGLDVDTNAINYDGTVIVGSARCGMGGSCSYFPMIMRWTESGAWEQLILDQDGYIANGEATAVSNDGSVVTGKLGLYGQPSDQLFIWTETSGVVAMDLPSEGCSYWGKPLISRDGRTIVLGCDPGAQESLFFRWTHQQGYEQLGSGHPIDLSTDGSIIVGVTADGNAFRYSDATGLQEIGPFTPSAANADCSKIVGDDVVWDEANGIQPVGVYLKSKGVELDSKEWVLVSATDISDDGSVIVGGGYNNIGMVIDNHDAGFSSGPSDWSWSQFTPGGYNNAYQFAPPGNGGQWATWTFYPRFYGAYEILAQWTSSDNRAVDASYEIDIPYTANGHYVVNVNQTQNGGKFNSLGIYNNIEYFSTPIPFEITLMDTPSGYVVADAVKIIFQDRGWLAKIDTGSNPDPQPAEIIIDNTDAGFSSRPSKWQSSQYTPGGYGTSYQYAPPGNGDSWAVWTFTLAISGNCEVFAQWTASDNRSTAAPYTIINNGTQIPVIVDQTINGGRFVSLGTYWLEAGTVQVVLNDTPTGYVIADAAKLVYTASSDSLPVIVDNTDAGFSTTGTWGASIFTPGYYGNNYRYAAPGSDADSAKWSFVVPRSDNYEIFAQWPAFGNRSPEAPYAIINNNTISETTMDQRQNGGRFVSLGVYWLEAGSVDVVLSGTPTGYVVADAIKINLR